MHPYKYTVIKRKRVDDHRVIANAENLGWYTVVHHKDGNKLNNAPENLEIMSRAEHARIHALQNGLGTKIQSNPVVIPDENGMGICKKCGEVKKWDDFSSSKENTYGKRSTCKKCHNKKALEWKNKKKEAETPRKHC